MSRFSPVSAQEFRKILTYHVWFGRGTGEGQADLLVSRLYKDAPDQVLVFPFPFQETLVKILTAEGPGQVTEPEALFLYDSVYRMLYEMVYERPLPPKESTCFDKNGDPIKRKALKKPDGYWD